MANPIAEYTKSAYESNAQTMTSLQVAEITGRQHSNVLRDIRNLLEQLEDRYQFNFELVEYTDRKGENRPCYILTKKDYLLLASGYDANLRAKIINRWEELELKQREFPLTKSERTLATIRQLCELAERDVELERKQIQLEQEQRAIANKVSEIEKIVKPNGFMSVMGFANIHHLNIGKKAAQSIGRLASKWCKRAGIMPEKTKHERYGAINTYPIDALKACFGEFYPNMVL